MTEIKKYKGRPTDHENSSEKETKCYDFLDSLGIEYEVCTHYAAEDMELCKAIEEKLGCEICKNLFLCNRQETAFYLLMMPADKPFKTKELSKQIGSARLSFASAEKMEEYLNITPGSVSVLGLMNDGENKVRLLIDDELTMQEYIGVHPCKNTASVKLKMEDILEKVLPKTKHDITFVSLIGE